MRRLIGGLSRAAAALALAAGIGVAPIPAAAEPADPAWMVSVLKATCVAFLAEPEKAESVAKSRGYAIDKPNGWFLDGREDGRDVSIVMVRVQAEPLTFRQCTFNLASEAAAVPEERLRAALIASYPGLTFGAQPAIAGLYAFTSSEIAVGKATLRFQIVGKVDNGVKAPVGGLIIDRVR